MKGKSSLSRREFFQKSIAFGAAAYGASLVGWPEKLLAQETAFPDLVAVKNGEPDVMLDKAMTAIGGMSRFVQKGQTVIVKPNIGWNREAETGADTNPLLVKRVVEHCIQAGAKKVYVFDHVIDESAAEKTYAISGIAGAAKAAGAVIVPAHDKKYYQEVEIPNATRLKKTSVHELVMETDALINVPVLKHHMASSLTIAMKNLMGIVWDRNAWHSSGLNACIAEFCLYKKPTLNIVDAYAVTMKNGPHRARKEDLDYKKTLLVSPDIVAIDAAATKVFGSDPANISYIKQAHDLGIGNMNLDTLKIERIAL